MKIEADITDKCSTCPFSSFHEIIDVGFGHDYWWCKRFQKRLRGGFVSSRDREPVPAEECENFTCAEQY